MINLEKQNNFSGKNESEIYPWWWRKSKISPSKAKSILRFSFFEYDLWIHKMKIFIIQNDENLISKKKVFIFIFRLLFESYSKRKKINFNFNFDWLIDRSIEIKCNLIIIINDERQNVRILFWENKLI